MSFGLFTDLETQVVFYTFQEMYSPGPRIGHWVGDVHIQVARKLSTKTLVPKLSAGGHVALGRLEEKGFKPLVSRRRVS